MSFDFENIEVLPDYVEAVLVHHGPPPEELVGDVWCAGCGALIEPGAGMCWGIPGRGVFHEDCYGPDTSDT